MCVNLGAGQAMVYDESVVGRESSPVATATALLNGDSNRR